MALYKMHFAHYATEKGLYHLLEIWENYDFCQYLDNKKRKPIHLAAYYGHWDIFKLLIKPNELWDCSDDGKNGLHHAILGEQEAFVTSMLSLEKTQLERDQGESNCLNDSHGTYRLWLNQNQQITATHIYPIHLAILKKNLSLVKTIVTYHPNALQQECLIYFHAGDVLGISLKPMQLAQSYSTEEISQYLTSLSIPKN